WRRHHSPALEASLQRGFGNMLRQNEVAMGNLGIFGESIVEEMDRDEQQAGNKEKGEGKDGHGGPGGPPSAPGAGGGGGFGGGRGGDKGGADDAKKDEKPNAKEPDAPPAGDPATGGDPSQPSIRKNFADTAFWKGD